ncbi:MAG: hypothetical protein E6H09_19530 [Bacteroidetes bacterium]|jgi:hypothetical protein|nr:MAG: hypothetical protein E6H09_19530 [Bacteroidota bacterium]
MLFQIAGFVNNNPALHYILIKHYRLVPEIIKSWPVGFDRPAYKIEILLVTASKLPSCSDAPYSKFNGPTTIPEQGIEVFFKKPQFFVGVFVVF